MALKPQASSRVPTSANVLCRRCIRSCRQSNQVLLLDCPRFVPRPFKVQKPPGEQLNLFGK